MTKRIAYIALIVCSIILLIIFSPIYSANDDVMLASILSGSFSGTPSFYTTYLGVFVSWILSSLYRLTNIIPWYGIVIFLSIYIPSIHLCMKCLEHSGEGKKSCVGILALVIVFLGLSVKWLLLPTYTVAAGFLVAGAMATILLKTEDEKNWKTYFLAFLYLFFAYEMRSKVCLMALPFIAVLLFYQALRKKDKNVLIGTGILFVSLGVLIIGLPKLEGLFLQEEAFKQYISYNDLRTDAYDFSAVYENDAANAYYEKQGISAEEILLDRSQNLMLKDCSKTDSLQVYVDYEKEIGNAPIFKKMIWQGRNYLTELIQEKNIFLNLLLMVLMLLAILSSVFHRREGHLVFDILLILAVWFGKIIITLYFMAEGRYPERVTFPLALWEGVTYLGIFLNGMQYDTVESGGKKASSKEVSVLVLETLGVLASVVILVMGISEYRVLQNRNQAYREVYEEMETKTSKCFLLDTYSFCNNTESVFPKTVLVREKGTPDNTMILGGWLTGSPLVTEKCHYYHGEDAASLLKNGTGILVLKEDIPRTSKEIIENYLDISLLEVNTVSTDEGKFVFYQTADVVEHIK